MKTNASNIKRGSYIELNDSPWQVMDTSHNFRGRGGANMKVKMKNIETGSVIEKNFNGDEMITIPDIEKRFLQFLYHEGNKLAFMNEETYEQYELDASLAGDMVRFLKEGEKMYVLFWEDTPLSLQPPKSVRLTVTESEVAVRGDTATNARKTVVVETGAKVQVPLFIKRGEMIVINPETGQYIERAN